MQLLLVAFIAWLSAQIVKFSIRSFDGRPDPKILYQSGGMPSAHVATVTALTVAALTTQGLQSPVLGVSAVLAAIVIYDSLGVRRASGEQSIMVNALLRASGDSRLVREIVGHKPAEVWVGSGIGVAIGAVMTYRHWTDQARWLVDTPVSWEQTTYLIIFAALVVVAFIVRFVLSRLRKVKVTIQLKSALWWGVATPGFVGLFFSLLQYQTTNPGAWRLWPLLIGLAFVIIHVILSLKFYPTVAGRYREEVKHLKAVRKQQRRAQKKKAKKAKKRRK